MQFECGLQLPSAFGATWGRLSHAARVFCTNFLIEGRFIDWGKMLCEYRYIEGGNVWCKHFDWGKVHWYLMVIFLLREELLFTLIMLVICVLRRTVGWRQERMMFFFPSSAAGSHKLSCHLLLDLSARHSCISPFPCPLSKCDLITDRELIFHYRCLDRLLLITILSQKPLLLLSGLVFLNTGRVLWQNLAERKSEPWTGVAGSPLGKISGLCSNLSLLRTKSSLFLKQNIWVFRATLGIRSTWYQMDLMWR